MIGSSHGPLKVFCSVSVKLALNDLQIIGGNVASAGAAGRNRFAVPLNGVSALVLLRPRIVTGVGVPESAAVADLIEPIWPFGYHDDPFLGR